MTADDSRLWTDRARLRDVQYRTDANLAARQSIYAFQHPPLDLPARVSAASAWEISIKKALGTLVAPDDLEHQVLASGFLPLPISLGHGVAAGGSIGITRIPSTGC
jgi:PIN domain nuclease of toxin-antitoxin system